MRARDPDCDVVKTRVSEMPASGIPSGPPLLAVPAGTFGEATQHAVERLKVAFPTTERAAGSNKRRYWGANRNADESGVASASVRSSGDTTSEIESSKRRRFDSVDYVA